jgi:hypothetical protein
MTQANLTETLFKPRFKHPETSTLVRRFNPGIQPAVQSALDGKNVPHWYRMINRLMWIWRGIDPREILDVQARIVMSEPSAQTANSTTRWSAIVAETGSTNGLNRRCSGSKSQPGRGCHAQRQALAACGQSLRHCRLPAFKR